MKKIKLHPGYILLKRQEFESEAGILLTEDVKQKPGFATVVDANDVQSIKPGDSIIYVPFGPLEFTVEDEEYLIAREEDILAILED